MKVLGGWITDVIEECKGNVLPEVKEERSPFFKNFKKEIAKYFSKHLKEKGWIFDIDLLNLAKKEGYQIKEFPIIWEDDDGSHIGTLDGIKSILNVIKYKFTS